MDTKKCLVCGKIFKRPTRRTYSSWKLAKYCSLVCYQQTVDKDLLQKRGCSAWQGKHHTEEWKKEHKERMTGKKNPLYGKKHTKESREKMSKAHKGKVGEKAGNWKGGTTKLRKVIKQCFKYRQWRSDVFTRDRWICQDCGGRKRGIEAHHIKGLAIILREYKIKTMEQALECEALWDINNGITFCFGCHEKRHKRLKNLRNRPRCKQLK